MDKIFKLTNNTSETVSEDQEIIGVGFINHGEYAFLNNCTLNYDSLSIEEKAIVDPFLDMMKTKMLICRDDSGDGTGGDSES